MMSGYAVGVLSPLIQWQIDFWRHRGGSGKKAFESRLRLAVHTKNSVSIEIVDVTFSRC